MELRCVVVERLVPPLNLESLDMGGGTWVNETKGWYLAKRRRKRGRVAAALPIIMPRPGSTEDRIASSAVASEVVLVEIFGCSM